MQPVGAARTNYERLILMSASEEELRRLREWEAGSTAVPVPPGRAAPRDTYGFPMFLGAWLGANAQWAGLQWPEFGFVAFLTAVVLILWFARAFNRR